MHSISLHQSMLHLPILYLWGCGPQKGWSRAKLRMHTQQMCQRILCWSTITPCKNSCDKAVSKDYILLCNRKALFNLDTGDSGADKPRELNLGCSRTRRPDVPKDTLLKHQTPCTGSCKKAVFKRPLSVGRKWSSSLLPEIQVRKKKFGNFSTEI